MSKPALLLRLDPKEWPVWEDELRKKPDYEVWFETGGRRGPEDVQPNIPVFVLGTIWARFGRCRHDIKRR